MAVKWVFDPAPPSGKRTGGNAAEYSFEGQIDILVREVIQNSLDAALSDDQPVAVRFRLIDLVDGQLDDFRESIEWPTLEDNLRAVPKKRGGTAISQAIEKMEKENRLRLLIIEDRGTRGLEGTERRTSDDERNSFCALVRDELYSDKAADDAGGSFGLGKSVLWAYSSFKTVLFASSPVDRPRGKAGLRFIGRASLPYHESADDGPCSGDGWLGIARRPRDPAARHAESVWAGEAARVATGCGLGRPEKETGLSTMILGFSEPGEEDRGPEEILQAIVDKALESFWPAIARGSLVIHAERGANGEVHDELSVDPLKHPAYALAAELLLDFDRGQVYEVEDALDIGQSGMSWVPIQVPERLEEPAHPEMQVQVPVLIRVLEDDGDVDPIRDKIFRFRRPGLVVRSGGGSRLSIAARSYVACVLGGRASHHVDEKLDHLERFLRCAEPPAHDQWTHNTRSIKQQYRSHGCRKKLEDFDRRVVDLIRKLVSQPEEKGGQLPKNLLKHLRFGDRGGSGKARFLSVTHTRARIEDDSWKFEMRCRRTKPDGDPWHVAVHFKYASDGGRADDVHAIDSVECDAASRIEIRRGVGFLEFPGNVDKATVKGHADPDSLPAVGTRSAVSLRVDGRKGEMPDA